MTLRGNWTAAACLFVLSAAFAITGPARAADNSSDSGAVSGPHTLFNPTPASELREMAPDRPNVTNTPQTIGAGHLQLEEGFFDYVRARSDKLSPYKSFVFGHSNFRLGVLDNLELNLAIDSYDMVWNTDDGSGRSRRQTGIGDTTIGGKWNIWGDDGSDDPWATALAIQPQVKLPSARHSIGNGHTEFVVNVPFSISLIDDFHLGLQTAIADQRNRANTGGRPASARKARCRSQALPSMVSTMRAMRCESRLMRL